MAGWRRRRWPTVRWTENWWWWWVSLFWRGRRKQKGWRGARFLFHWFSHSRVLLFSFNWILFLKKKVCHVAHPNFVFLNRQIIIKGYLTTKCTVAPVINRFKLQPSTWNYIVVLSLNKGKPKLPKKGMDHH